MLILSALVIRAQQIPRGGALVAKGLSTHDPNPFVLDCFMHILTFKRPRFFQIKQSSISM